MRPHARQIADPLRVVVFGHELFLLLGAAGCRPTATAAVLFCSRSSVYRTVRAHQKGRLSWEHDAQGRPISPVRTTFLLPPLRRSLLALLKAPPQAYGGGAARAGAVRHWP
jgi:hypothetical protein